MPENAPLDPAAAAAAAATTSRALPRITSGVFRDLAVWMIGLGLLTGIVFPFFVILLAVPARIALAPVFMLACISAGVGVGGLNYVLARSVVGQRIRNLNLRMRGLTTEVRQSSVTAGAEASRFRLIPATSSGRVPRPSTRCSSSSAEHARRRPPHAMRPSAVRGPTS